MVVKAFFRDHRRAFWKTPLLDETSLRYRSNMEREEAIVLIGFMGAGKTSVGHELARLTKWPLYETDVLVETRFDLSIADIFAFHGEEKFRDAESAVLRGLPTRRAVVATGGGIVRRAENVEMLQRLGGVVYLQADETSLLQRLSSDNKTNRPLLQKLDLASTLSRLLHEREPIYRATADFTVNTTGMSVRDIAQKIFEHVR